jgi:hypothetical protein
VIFNQSAIAWRKGKAGVADMSETERNLARIHAAADNVLPYTQNGNYFVVSPWKDATTDGSRTFYGRGIATAGDIPAMAGAFRKAIEAGRSAYLSGLGRVLDRGASASDPLTGFLHD